MNFRTEQLPAGLYFIATPIGNARDITLRALDVLASANVIAAEDTRSARRLMEIHGVPLAGRRLIAYHDHSRPRARDEIANLIANGQSCAYVSEAGTPLISDPGFALGRAVLERNGSLWSVPGPSAVIAALSVAGLPSDRFMFLGFMPTKSAQRKALWDEMRDVQATLVFYESPKRVHQSLDDLCETLGEDRNIVICRELTKRFEEIMRATAGELRERVEKTPLRGECVILVDRAKPAAVSDETIETALIAALKTMRVKDAAVAVSGRLGISKRDVYARAIAISSQQSKGE